MKIKHFPLPAQISAKTHYTKFKYGSNNELIR